MKDFITILVGIITIAIIAVLVSNNAQTGNVISSFFTGFSNSIKAAVAPAS